MSDDSAFVLGVTGGSLAAMGLLYWLMRWLDRRR